MLGSKYGGFTVNKAVFGGYIYTPRLTSNLSGIDGVIETIVTHILLACASLLAFKTA